MNLKLISIESKDAFLCKKCGYEYKLTYQHADYKGYCKACIHLYGKEIVDGK